MARATKSSDPVFTVKIKHGLADRHRLPLEHVLTVLSEVRQMFVDAGSEIQEAAGRHKPDGDFGLELLAGAGGTAFRKGSLEARIAITADQADGLIAAGLIVETVRGLAKGKLDPPPGDNAETRIIRRLNKIAKVNKSDKVDMQFSLKRPERQRAVSAIFGPAAVSYAKSLADAELQQDEVTVFGKLKEIEDRDLSDVGGKDVYGELRLDNGETWRVQFKGKDRGLAKQLFGEQVAVTGTVSYYRVASPRIEVTKIELDPERDYVGSFDELFGCNRDLYKSDLDSLLEEIRG